MIAAILAAIAAPLAGPPCDAAATARAVGAPAEAEVHGPAATAREVLQAERDFACRAAREGLASAFGAVMEPNDARAFMGGDPVRGAASIATAYRQLGPSAKLAWGPAEVFASTGDMAVDWGRWRLETPGHAVTGRYVTVWRRAADGGWRALVDVGTPDPP